MVSHEVVAGNVGAGRGTLGGTRQKSVRLVENRPGGGRQWHMRGRGGKQGAWMKPHSKKERERDVGICATGYADSSWKGGSISRL